MQPPILSNAQFNCTTPDTNLTILKTVNATTFYPGQAVAFTVTVTNNGPYVASSVKIGDIRPANTACLIPGGFGSATPMTQTSVTNPYEWTLTNTVAVGQTVTLSLNGQIANSPSCVGNYINTATLKYIVNGQLRT